MNNREWLLNLKDTNTSGPDDETLMEALLRKVGFPKARCTCGMVYIEGTGPATDIHSMAGYILRMV